MWTVLAVGAAFVTHGAFARTDAIAFLRAWKPRVVVVDRSPFVISHQLREYIDAHIMLSSDNSTYGIVQLKADARSLAVVRRKSASIHEIAIVLQPYSRQVDVIELKKWFYEQQQRRGADVIALLDAR